MFSSQFVPRSELESLLRQFGAQPAVFRTGKPEPGSWSVPITGGELVVSEATSDNLRAMPPRMIDEAGVLLGMAPVYCLSSPWEPAPTTTHPSPRRTPARVTAV